MCPECGRPHSRGKHNRCPNCYMKAYRKNPLNRRRHIEAVKRYQERNPEKYAKWSWTWERRTGRLIPIEVHTLRYAIKLLEQAVAATEVGTPVRLPSQRRLHSAVKREARLGNSQSILRHCQDSITSGNCGGSTFTILADGSRVGVRPRRVRGRK